ncbi:hypothetical protein BH23ACT9_BH23ACT9_01080 [soil metagenome]
MVGVMTTDERLRRLASACRYRLLTLADAERIGISRFAVAHAARTGVLQRHAPGLYGDADAPTPGLQRYAIPQRYLDGLHRRRRGVQAALTGRAALEVMTGQLADEGPLMMALPIHRQARFRTRRFAVRRVRWDTTVIQKLHGLRLVDAAQALADEALPGHLDDADLRTLVDWARSHLRLEVPGLVKRWSVLDSLGAGRLLAMEAAGVFEQESEGERHAFDLLFAGHGPLPDCQVVVLGGFRVDFVFLDAALVIEYDGRDAHQHRFETDATRRFAIEALGYRIVTVTSAMLREPDGLRTFITNLRLTRRALIERGALPLPALPMQPPRMRPLTTLLHPPAAAA